MSTEIIFGLSVFIAIVSFVCGYTLFLLLLYLLYAALH
ncbi:hypothetical protein [Escherichia phage AV123]|nr:hypothetical protein bas61_0257 [Escherichia phage EmilieFrey]WPK37549.1 hypothetical protein [Escherichia phage AV123]